MKRAQLVPWIVRAAWAALPFTAGPAFAAALDARSAGVRTVATLLLWGGWAIGLCSALVLHPISLTLLRLATPGAVLASAWTLGGAGSAPALIALGSAVLAVAVAYLPETGMSFVNGPAYPNERRFPLRAPGPLLVGPIQLAWVAAVATPAAAALLLASRLWVRGALASVVAFVGIAVTGRALHGLSRRWIVFVPAGIVLHDPIALVDPVLFQRTSIASFDLAPADTDALDLTQRSPGLAVELVLTEPATLLLTKPGSRVGPSVSASKIILTPTRPGGVLAEARARGF